MFELLWELIKICFMLFLWIAGAYAVIALFGQITIWLGGDKQTVKHDNGDVYYGQTNENKAEGKGKYTWKNGDVYEGDFVGDMRHGKGKYTWADGEVYEGDFKDNHRTGKGIMHYKDGGYYEGDFVKGEREGYGTYINSEGERFEGYWKADMLIIETDISKK